MSAARLVAQLAKARRSRRLSVQAAADRVGYSDASLYRWERGAAYPSLEAFIDYADSLGYLVTLVPKGAAKGDRRRQSGAFPSRNVTGGR